jgi:hypothetical protein
LHYQVECHMTPTATSCIAKPFLPWRARNVDLNTLPSIIQGAFGMAVLCGGYFQFIKGKRLDSAEKAADRTQAEVVRVTVRSDNMQLEIDKLREKVNQLDIDKVKIEIGMEKKTAEFERVIKDKDDLHDRQIALLKDENLKQVALIKLEYIDQIKLIKEENVAEMTRIREKNTLLEAENITFRQRIGAIDIIGVVGREHLQDKGPRLLPGETDG